MEAGEGIGVWSRVAVAGRISVPVVGEVGRGRRLGKHSEVVDSWRNSRMERWHQSTW
jgi:hypothetical protein